MPDSLLARLVRALRGGPPAPVLAAAPPRYSARVMQAYEAGPRGGLQVRAGTGEEPAEILLYDEIGPWGTTASDFVAALTRAGAGRVRVRINSPGGDVFDGLAMFNALRARPDTEVVVDGLAASAASIVAMSAPCTMSEASMLMIHKAWTLAVGNADDLRDVCATLDKVDGQLAAIYAGKCGKDVADCLAMMAAETWLTAAEAKEAGLADTVLPPPKSSKQASTPEPVRAGSAFVEQARRRLRAAESE